MQAEDEGLPVASKLRLLDGGASAQGHGHARVRVSQAGAFGLASYGFGVRG